MTGERRPAVSDIALALATRRSDPVSKVELSLNAKGDVQISVDVSDADPKKAAEAAANLFDVLRAKYPRSNGGGEISIGRSGSGGVTIS